MKLPDDDLKRSKHVGVVLSVLKCFKLKLHRCICWSIVEVRMLGITMQNVSLRMRIIVLYTTTILNILSTTGEILRT